MKVTFLLQISFTFIISFSFQDATFQCRDKIWYLVIILVFGQQFSLDFKVALSTFHDEDYFHLTGACIKILFTHSDCKENIVSDLQSVQRVRSIMKKIRLSDTDFDLFDMEISPGEFIFFSKHKEAFRCMWKEQVRNAIMVLLNNFNLFATTLLCG